MGYVFGNRAASLDGPYAGRRPAEHKFTGETRPVTLIDKAARPLSSRLYRTACGIWQPIHARALGNEDRFVSCLRCRAAHRAATQF